MEFGCHTWGFNDKSLRDALGTIARLGFRYVDIGSGSQHLDVVKASEKPEKVADEFRRYLDIFHLKVSDLYLMLPRISVGDDERRHHEIKSFEALLPFARALGTPGITVSPGIGGQGEPEAAQARAVDALRQFVELADDIAVSFEPHMDSIAQTPDVAMALVSEVEGLKITLDWSQMVTQGIKPDDVAGLLPYVRHVQIRQAAPMRMQTPFEQGVLDLKRVMTLLMSAGYDDVITIEHMQTIGWHGATEVDTITEALHIRQELQAIREHFNVPQTSL